MIFLAGRIGTVLKHSSLVSLTSGISWYWNESPSMNGSLARYAKLRVAHAPGMTGTFSPPSRVSDPDMHHGTCVTHVPWCMSGSLTSGFLWSRGRGKRSRHSRRMRNPQLYLSGKRSIDRVENLSKDNGIYQYHFFHSVFLPTKAAWIYYLW